MKVMEYDVNIKVTKFIRGKGLCEQLVDYTENNEKENEEVVLVHEDNEPIVVAVPPTSWVQEMMNFLQTGECPKGLNNSKQRYYRLQDIPYIILDGIFFRKDFNGVFLTCIDSYQTDKILEEFHNGPAGGHFAPWTTTLKIMRGGYFWPDLHKDAYAWVRKCKNCVVFAGKQKIAALPLQPVQIEQPFMKWGLDFIRVINPPSSSRHK
ncbi:hypothetical protein SUGI_0057080 [Cryptomeria japonica]|nr:hypothetical protein SUGI_0057080 [Cryptomeria japonica]